MNATASEKMMENKMVANGEKVEMVFPSMDVQKFIFDSVNQMSYPGAMAEYVADVKRMIGLAEIKGQ